MAISKKVEVGIIQTSGDREFIYTLLLSEMKINLEEIYSGITASKKFVQQIFTSSSLLIAIISSLQIFNEKIFNDNSLLFTTGIFVVALLYIVQVALCIIVMSPVGAIGVVGSDWDVLFPAYVNNKTKIEALRQHLSSYIKAVNANYPIMLKRAKLARITGYLFPIIILLLFILSFINRLPF